MINAVTDIQEDTTVEIVINVQPLGDEDVEIRPHALSVHSYKTPTFCNFCGEMLFGMFKQVKLVVKPGIARECCLGVGLIQNIFHLELLNFSRD